MAIPRVLSGLAKKRGQLAAELEHHEAQAERCRKDIATIDGALALWKQGMPLRKSRYLPHETVVPHLAREIVDTLRDASEPPTARQIIDAIADGRNLDRDQWLRLQATVYWRLRDMRKDGRLVSEKRGGRVRWTLSP